MRRFLIAIGLVLAGCAVPHAPSVGRFDSEGPNAYLNGKRAFPGAAVNVGDEVSTGPGSSVRVRLTRGGVVLLDENTDPNFFEEAGCLVIQVLSGRVFVEGTDVCIRTPGVDGKLHSSVVLRVGRGTDLVVLEGTFSLQRPVVRTLTRNSYLSVTPDGRAGERTLQPSLAQELAGWRQRWFQNAPQPAPQPVPPIPGVAPPPPAQSGYCCLRGGAATPSTYGHCQSIGGTFYRDQATAVAQCKVVVN